MPGRLTRWPPGAALGSSAIAATAWYRCAQQRPPRRLGRAPFRGGGAVAASRAPRCGAWLRAAPSRVFGHPRRRCRAGSGGTGRGRAADCRFGRGRPAEGAGLGPPRSGPKSGRGSRRAAPTVSRTRQGTGAAAPLRSARREDGAGLFSAAGAVRPLSPCGIARCRCSRPAGQGRGRGLAAVTGPGPCRRCRELFRVRGGGEQRSAQRGVGSPPGLGSGHPRDRVTPGIGAGAPLGSGSGSGHPWGRIGRCWSPRVADASSLAAELLLPRVVSAGRSLCSNCGRSRCGSRSPDLPGAAR